MTPIVILTLLVAAAAPGGDAGPSPGEPSAPAPEQSRVVVLAHLSSSSGEAAAELEAAVRAQLGGLDVELAVSQLTPLRPDVGAKIATAQALARARNALGVFWVEPLDDAELLLYLVDAEGKALLRRVRRDPAGVSAEADSVAMIVRASTNSLLSGRSIGMEPVEAPPRELPPPPKAPERPVPPKAVDRRPPVLVPGYPYFGLDLSYAGTSLAPQAPWQNGLLLRASAYPTRGPWYLGVGFTFYQAFTATEPFVDGPDQTELIATVVRHPLQAFAGYQLVRKALLFDAEAAVVVDLATARGSERDRLTEFAESGEIRTLIGIEPRVRFHWLPLPQMSLSLMFGAEIMALQEPFDFLWIDREDGSLKERRTYLDPFPVRPTIGAGVNLWLPARRAVVRKDRRRRAARSRAPRRR